ncbi:MAG: response regulator [Bacteroidota bacterium]
MEDFELYKRRIEREKLARKEAEGILEKKALELFTANERLQKLYKTKDELLEAISKALIVLFREEDLDRALRESIHIVGSTIDVDRFSIATLQESENKYTLLKNYEHANREFKSLFNLLKEQENLDELFYRFAQIFLKGNKLVKFTSSHKQHRLVTRTMGLIGLSSVVLMPIEYQGKIKAIISLELLDIEYDWSENDEAILLAFAAGVESVIEKFETREKLEEQRSFYEAVLNSIPSDLVVFNKNHTYKFINPVAIQNAEIREWLIDKDDFEYVEYRNKPKELAENRRAIFNKVVNEKEPLSFEERFVNNEGEEEWKLRNMYPVFSEDEQLEMVIGYGVDITDIKQTNQQLLTTSKRLSTLISSLNSGVLLEDKDRKILVTNDEFCSIFDIPAKPEDLIGIDCSNSAEQSKHLVKNPDQFVARIDEIVKNRRIQTNEEIHMNDGRTFERDFIPIYLQDIYLGHLWEYRNVTEKKAAEQELIRAREEAEESRRLKQRFLANMSHEIRTPMNGVVGIVHLLERTKLDHHQKKYLNILKDSSEHLLHIINDILDVSKLEEGKLVLNESPVQLDTLIEGVVQNLKSRASDKKIKIELEGLEIFDSLLMTDPVRVRQVLLNLLSNAIKFTHKGSVGIRCSTLSNDNLHHAFRIEVWDTGIGIPENNMESIFSAFDQSDIGSANQYGGTGLGLSIVQELADKLGSEISVQSEVGKGSTFTLQFDLKKVEADQVSMFKSSQFELSGATLEGIHILVVDDHKVNFDIAEEILQTWGATVLYAENGKKAVESITENEVDLILMDMQMPVMDGIEATRNIRQLDSPLSDVPIIAMTAAALPEEREKCLQSGMNGYISKPYNPSILFETIANQLDLDAEVEVKTDDASDSYTNSGALFDISYLKELSGNNRTFIEEMVNNFKNEMPEMVEEMKFCYTQFDSGKISAIAHKAKSMAGYLGAHELRNTIVALEEKIEQNTEVRLLEQDLDRIEEKLNNVLRELNHLYT